MKGKKTFTISQREEIKRLIAKKAVATTIEQKLIRNEIRKLGFYFSDFSNEKQGYTVADFENLINSSQIQIISNDSTSPQNTIPTLKPIKKLPILNSKNKRDNLLLILEKIKPNRFDPIIDADVIIPDNPGNYIICLKPTANFPISSVYPVFATFHGFRVIYTGIAGTSLKLRDYRQHFKGNNAGRSTLRKSLGVLFAYKQIPRDKGKASKQTKFCSYDEARLTEWMCSNLIIFLSQHRTLQ